MTENKPEEGSPPDATPTPSVPVQVPPIPPDDEVFVAQLADTPPSPGLGESLLWCLAFFIVSNGAVILGFTVAFFAQAFQSPNWREYTRQAFDFRDNSMSALLSSQAVADALAPAVATGQAASLIFVLVVIRVRVGPSWRRLLALRRPALSHVAIVLLGLPAMLILPGAIAEEARKRLPTVEYQTGLEEILRAWPWWFSVLQIGIGAGLIEELWFRGFLGRGLIGHFGISLGVLFSSILFGLMHGDPPHVVATFFMGAGLHFMYLASRSLWIPILVHALNNSMAVVQQMSPDFRDGAAKLDQAPPDAVRGLYFAALVLAAAVGWALYRSRVYLVEEADAGVGDEQAGSVGVECPTTGSGLTLQRDRVGLGEWAGVLFGLACCVSATLSALNRVPGP